jgi:hypothetical protein
VQANQRWHAVDDTINAVVVAEFERALGCGHPAERAKIVSAGVIKEMWNE